MSATPPAQVVLPEWASSVEELLQLPRTQVAAILAEVGEPASKVWLALIYRLAALETQVKTLAAELRRSAAPSAPILAVSKKSRGSRKPVGEEGAKTDVLEKVFRKNLSLRKAP